MGWAWGWLLGLYGNGRCKRRTGGILIANEDE